MTLSDMLAADVAAFPALHPLRQILALLATALVAGLARGFSGFGGGLIFIPMASAIAGPQAASPLLLVVDWVMTLGMLPEGWRRANRREVATLLIGALAGVPVGTALLAFAPPLVLRWIISVTVIALLAFLISGWRYKGRPKAPLGVATGAVAGLFGGVAQLSGPPIVAYWLGGASDRVVVRANIVLYFALASLISATAYISAGLLRVDTLLLAAVVGPGYGLGILLGSRLFGFADEATFRRICFCLIAGAGLLSLPVFDALLH
ncbi:putative membrane protein YfcA [Neorhizobium galegae]|uniref:sulfite exporter TauE/SafE family protein n=1 Tax=Neorhizobium galegae TaxID=399 RepID=UPI001AE7BC0A|nr:sulfite exporter TauE/SafE family protein [Neorhizobium galegae]MBP2547753.1 putative membrane protein YfcA [Neorhizobium galegae]